MKEKSELRQEIKEKLSALSKPLYEHWSLAIARALYETKEWNEAAVIGLTISKAPEVDTYQIIRKAWELGKTVVIPKCNPKDKSMTFRTLTSFTQLESVYFGLYEPIEKETKETVSSEIDLLIVPGVAYNLQGYRVGFGGGYYDRYLSAYTGKTASLAFTPQINENLPVEQHDLPVSKLITEKGIIEPG
jgi:5-formyltetrahydrofolate cyclo-ligase